MTDPLNFKPQLSSLADSVSFGIWCDSKLRDKIVLGGQDVPHGDEQHREVFGSPDDAAYDGLHMRGPNGRSFLNRSYQKVFIKTQLIKANSDLYSPNLP